MGRGQPANGLGNAECNDRQADEHSDVGSKAGQGKGAEPHNHDVVHPDELKEKIELRMVLCRTGTVVNNDLAQSGGIGARIWGANALDVLFAEELSSFGEVTLNLHTGWYIEADAPLLRGLASAYEATGRRSFAWACRDAGDK